MKDTTRVRLRLKENLDKLPREQLEKVNDFVAELLSDTMPASQQIASLEGIWQGMGFADIDDLEKEIQTARKEMSEDFVNKHDRWTI